MNIKGGKLLINVTRGSILDYIPRPK